MFQCAQTSGLVLIWIEHVEQLEGFDTIAPGNSRLEQQRQHDFSLQGWTGHGLVLVLEFDAAEHVQVRGEWLFRFGRTDCGFECCGFDRGGCTDLEQLRKVALRHGQKSWVGEGA